MSFLCLLFRLIGLLFRSIFGLLAFLSFLLFLISFLFALLTLFHLRFGIFLLYFCLSFVISLQLWEFHILADDGLEPQSTCNRILIRNILVIVFFMSLFQQIFNLEHTLTDQLSIIEHFNQAVLDYLGDIYRHNLICPYGWHLESILFVLSFQHLLSNRHPYITVGSATGLTSNWDSFEPEI